MLYALLWDTALIAGFGMVHSGMASFFCKNHSKIVIAPHYYRLVFSLTTACYILLAAYLWRDVNYILYAVTGTPKIILNLLCALGWVMYFYSHLFYYEVGGVFGTSQLFAKSPLINSIRFDYSTNGLKKYIRFPVHTAFFLMFLTIPTITASTLIFALAATFYAWAGTLHHDYRYSKLFKEEYEAYKNDTGMVFPKFNKTGIASFQQAIYDSAPRKRSVPLIAVMTATMVLYSSIIILNYGYFINTKNSLVLIPFLIVVTAIPSALIALCGVREFKFTESTKLNLKNSEGAVFAMGVSIAITLGILFVLEMMAWNTQISIAAVIPAWVLGLITAHFIYYSLEYIFWTIHRSVITSTKVH